jgi:hypothetical protein
MVMNFLFSKSSRPALGSIQPPIEWVTGGGGLFSEVKWPGREADHTPPAIAEVKKMWILYIDSPIRLQGVVLNQLSTVKT